MRLLNTSTLRLTEFIGKIPPYAILSHTWETEEVLFEDLDLDPLLKHGWKKVTEACKVALEQRYNWIWIDTCCINKASSAELSESINSMFKWYENSDLCIVYLADVSYCSVGSQQLFNEMAVSRWFTRGWTLQELLAPRFVDFHSADWRLIAPRTEISSSIASITGIDESYVNGDRPVDHASVARRMSWASKRNTTRVEDLAYCLLGLFKVNMPLIYGEGQKAFRRLQEIILREVDDQSILAWGRMTSTKEVDNLRVNGGFWDCEGLLTDSPKDFEHVGGIVTFRAHQVETTLRVQHGGIAVDAPFWKGPAFKVTFGDLRNYDMLVPLQCRREKYPLECLALYFTSTSPTAHESGLDRKRIPCHRISDCVFSVQTSVWATKSRKFMFRIDKTCSRRDSDRHDKNQGFVLRTLPKDCRAVEIFPRNDPGTIIPFRYRMHRGPRDDLVALGLPTIVLLRRWGFPNLALVVQTSDTTDVNPSSINTSIVVIPPWYSLDEVADVIDGETERWFSEEICRAAQWKRARASSEAMVNGLAAKVARVLQQSKLESFDEFHISMSQDMSYGHKVFLLDIKDPTKGNVSMGPSLEEDAPTFTLVS